MVSVKVPATRDGDRSGMRMCGVEAVLLSFGGKGSTETKRHPMLAILVLARRFCVCVLLSIFGGRVTVHNTETEAKARR